MVACDICSKYDLDIHDEFFICKPCLPKASLCSKTKCKENYMLADSDLKDLPTLYGVKHSIYRLSDVMNVVSKRYGSLDKLQHLAKRKSQIKDIRRKELVLALADNKLEYKNYGDCYSYIQSGRPEIPTIITNELNRNWAAMTRRLELAELLSRMNINFDESNPLCRRYINGSSMYTPSEIADQLKQPTSLRLSFD